MFEIIDTDSSISSFKGAIRQKPDYEFKSKVLKKKFGNNSFVKLVKKVQKAKYQEYLFFQGDGLVLPGYTIDIEQANGLWDCFSFESPKELVEAKRIIKADNQRANRLHRRLEDLIQNPCLFLTLTFRDVPLHETTSEQRRVRVVRWLKSLNVPYIANVDYGAKNGREHYHCVVQLGRLTEEQAQVWRKQNGNVMFERVYTKKDPQALSKYVSKLTNHGIKETTKRSALIYSR